MAVTAAGLITGLNDMQSTSYLFGFLAIAIVLLVVFGHIGSSASNEYAQEARAWKARMDELQPIVDVEDDGHLFEWLDPPEWEAVFSKLDEMPHGARSLRAAISAVSPETPLD